MSNSLTGHWRQELRICWGFKEQQISSERYRLSENTVAQLQQDRHTALNWTTGLVAAAPSCDLHLAHTTSSIICWTVVLVYLESKSGVWNCYFPQRNTQICDHHAKYSSLYTVIPDSLAKLRTLMRFGQQPPSWFSSPTKTDEVM